jgi:hypothetical protein
MRNTGGLPAVRYHGRGRGLVEQVRELGDTLLRLVGRDHAAVDEVGHRRLHRDHAGLGADLHRRRDLVGLALADQVAHGGRADQHLDRRGATAADLVEQHLRRDAEQRLRHHGAHLRLLVGREHVDDAVDGLGRARRVHRAEHEVTGLGGGERERDGLEVAKLADQDHVGVLAQTAAQRVGERLGLGADLALVDQRALRLVHELDRVLEGEDVTRHGLVEVVDHRRERGRLAAAGRAGDEDEALLLVAQLAEDRRQPEILEARDLGGDGAEHGALAAVLHERVDAEAQLLVEREREVGLEAVLERAALAVVHDVEDEAVRLLRRQRRMVERHDLSVDAKARRLAGGEVHVRRLVLDGEAQELRHGQHQRSSTTAIWLFTT